MLTNRKLTYAIHKMADWQSLRMKVLLLAISLLMSACANHLSDVSTNIAMHSLTSPDGAYDHVAWLNDDLVAFAYSPNLEPNSWDYQIALYSVAANQWQTISDISLKICANGIIRWLNRLPDGELGFITECHLPVTVTDKFTTILYSWNAQTRQLTQIHQYQGDPYFHAADYTFKPDMSELLQAKINGKIFSVDKNNGLVTPILNNYKLVDSPRWSPDGKTLAFATSSGSDVLSLEPWDILLQQESQQPTKIMSGVQFAAFIKWSPLGRWLSFRGKYQNMDGIWVIDTTTLQLTRVWDDQSFYDWSPNGKQMIVIQRTKRSEVDGFDRTRPVIIDLPSNLFAIAR